MIKTLLSNLPLIGQLFGKATDLISEAVVDKDKRNEIFGALEEIRYVAYMTELGTKTIPWVDALHKMGRQIQVYALVGMGFYCMYMDIDFDKLKWVVMLVGGPSLVYQFLKGKGK